MQKRFALPGWLLPAGAVLLIAALILGRFLDPGLSPTQRHARGTNHIHQRPGAGHALWQRLPLRRQYDAVLRFRRGRDALDDPAGARRRAYDVMGNYLCVAESDALRTYQRKDDGSMALFYTKSLQGLTMDAVVCGKSHVALLTEKRDTIYVLDEAGSQVDTISLSGKRSSTWAFMRSRIFCGSFRWTRRAARR
jgi:hypothetical protein